MNKYFRTGESIEVELIFQRKHYQENNIPVPSHMLLIITDTELKKEQKKRYLP